MVEIEEDLEVDEEGLRNVVDVAMFVKEKKKKKEETKKCVGLGRIVLDGKLKAYLTETRYLITFFFFL